MADASIGFDISFLISNKTVYLHFKLPDARSCRTQKIKFNTDRLHAKHA